MIIGESSQSAIADKLRNVLESCPSGTIEVCDLEDVDKSKGGSYDEKLQRYFETVTGILFITSPGLKTAVEDGTTASIKINSTAIELNGEVVRGCIETLDSKIIIVSCEDTPSLPKGLDKKHVVKLPSGNITEKMLEDPANEITAIVKGMPVP